MAGLEHAEPDRRRPGDERDAAAPTPGGDRRAYRRAPAKPYVQPAKPTPPLYPLDRLVVAPSTKSRAPGRASKQR